MKMGTSALGPSLFLNCADVFYGQDSKELITLVQISCIEVMIHKSRQLKASFRPRNWAKLWGITMIPCENQEARLSLLKSFSESELSLNLPDLKFLHTSLFPQLPADSLLIFNIQLTGYD